MLDMEILVPSTPWCCQIRYTIPKLAAENFFWEDHLCSVFRVQLCLHITTSSILVPKVWASAYMLRNFFHPLGHIEVLPKFKIVPEQD